MNEAIGTFDCRSADQIQIGSRFFIHYFSSLFLTFFASTILGLSKIFLANKEWSIPCALKQIRKTPLSAPTFTLALILCYHTKSLFCARHPRFQAPFDPSCGKWRTILATKPQQSSKLDLSWSLFQSARTTWITLMSKEQNSPNEWRWSQFFDLGWAWQIACLSCYPMLVFTTLACTRTISVCQCSTTIDCLASVKRMSRMSWIQLLRVVVQPWVWYPFWKRWVRWCLVHIKSKLKLAQIFFDDFHPSCPKWGVPKIHLISVIASREGLTKLTEEHPDVDITVGMIDNELKEGIVLPGLGDSGDRLFGTYQLDDDEAMLHPSKRKRSASIAEWGRIWKWCTMGRAERWEKSIKKVYSDTCRRMTKYYARQYNFGREIWN